MELNLDPEIFGHPKYRRLVRKIGPAALHHLGLLWRMAKLYYWQDGVIRDQSVEDIEDALDWRGDPGGLVAVLVETAWLDHAEGVYAVHGWNERQGHIAAAKEWSRAANKKRWNKLHPGGGAPKSGTGSPPDVQDSPAESGPDSGTDSRRDSPQETVGDSPVDSTLPYPTLPYLTKTTTTEPPRSLLNVVSFEGTYGKGLDPVTQNLESHLLAEWGPQEGRIGYARVRDMLRLCEKHGVEAVFEAITIAGKANIRRPRYVEGILNTTGETAGDKQGKEVEEYLARTNRSG